MNRKSINKIYLTASGGPLYKFNINNFNKVTIKQALNHPNWKMEKNIYNSATLINKVYEVIEAKNIFNISYKNIDILIHPKSYIHALLKFNNGVTKIIAHDTTMKVPIFNTIFYETNKNIKTNDLNLKILNNLNFKKVDKKFPINYLKFT